MIDKQRSLPENLRRRTVSFLYDDEPLRNEAPTVLSEAPAPLAAKVRQALAESRPAAIVAADGSVRTLSGDAVAEVRSSRSETEAAAPSDAEPSAAGGRSGSRGERGATCRKGCRLAFVAADGRPHASRGSRTAFLRTGTGEAADVGGAFSPPDCRRRSRCRRGGRRRWLRLRPLMCSVRAAFSE